VELALEIDIEAGSGVELPAVPHTRHTTRVFKSPIEEEMVFAG
jgi:hypothetical protein